jgi:hypothetical protein
MPEDNNPIEVIDVMDRWIYGMSKIAKLAGLSERSARHHEKMGRLDVEKFGRLFRSTPRRILAGNKKGPRE